MLHETINTALLALIVVIGGAAVGFAYRTSGQLAKILQMVLGLKEKDQVHDERIETLSRGQKTHALKLGYLEGRLDERAKDNEEEK